MNKIVILIGPQHDRELIAVHSHLTKTNANILWWNSDNWPGNYPFDLSVNNSSQTLRINQQAIENINSVYVRGLNTNPKLPRFEKDLNSRPFALLNQLDEARSLFFSGMELLESKGTNIVNPVATMSVHSLKPMQMNLFQRAGLGIPDTLVTGDANAVIDFYHQHNGDVIYKPLGGGGYVRALSKNDLTKERLSLLSNSPVMFQKRIYGENLRLYIINNELVAAGKIKTDKLDYRTQEHDVEQIQPDSEIINAALQATQVLGLTLA